MPSRPAALLFVPFAAVLLGAAAARADLPRPPAEQYTVAVDAKPVKVGAKAQATVTVTPAAGHHVNKDYPTSLTLKAPAEVALAKPKMLKADGQVSEEKASFAVDYTANAPGTRLIMGTLKFAICTASTCDPRTAEVAIPVNAK
jgi:hypothetical protein